MQNKPPKGQILRYVPPVRKGGPPRFKAPGEYRPARARPSRVPFRSTTRKALEYGKARVGRAELPVVDPASEMMQELKTFGRLTSFLRRASPWLTAFELGLELGTDLYDWWKADGWARVGGQPGQLYDWIPCSQVCAPNGTHYYTVGSPCYYDQYSCTANHGTAPVPVGTPMDPSALIYDLFNQSPVIAWRYARGFHRPAATQPLPPEIGVGTPYVVPLRRFADEPEPGVDDPVPVPQVVSELSPTMQTFRRLVEAISPAPGGYGKIVVDADGHVDGKPSLQVAVAVAGQDLVPVGREVLIKTSGKTRARLAAYGRGRVKKHKWGRDGRTWASAPVYGLLKAYHAATEVSDALDVFADAMPDKRCSKLPATQKAVCVLQNLGAIEWSKVPSGLVYDHYEDKVVAALHRQAGKLRGVGDYHGPAGMQLQQFGRQQQNYMVNLQ